MKVSCPQCKQSYEIEEDDVGQEATCNVCGRTFVIRPPGFPQSMRSPLPRDAKRTASPRSDAASSKPVKCPWCCGEIAPGARKCRHCGEWLNAGDIPQNPVVYVLMAMVWGLFGAHNFYAGQWVSGIAKFLLLFGVILLWWFGVREREEDFLILSCALAAIGVIWSVCDAVLFCSNAASRRE